VVVGIGAGESCFSPLIHNGDFFDTMDGERQLGDLGLAILFVIQVELG
jgi:hypothetical protein